MRARILELLEAEPRTVPEIAAAMDCPTHEVLFWIMGMRRYGRVREVKGVTDDGYFRYEADREGPTMTALVDTEPADRPAALRRRGRLRLLQLRELHGDLPAGQRRLDLPAADDPLRPGGHARPAPLEQGAVDLLRLRRVLGDLPDPGRAERVHGGGPPLRHRQLRPDGPGPDDVHAPDRGHAHRDRAGGLLRALHVRGPWPAEHGSAGHLRVHPGERSSTTSASRSWSSCSRPAWSASPRWPGPWAAARA